MAITKSKIDDYELIRRVLAGETNLYGELQNRYKYQIKALIKKMIADRDDVEDLAQETFIKAYGALSRFQEGYTFSSWLYRIASNTCIDFLRKRRFPTISVSRPISTEHDEVYIDIEDTAPKADYLMIANERKNAIRSALNALPEKYQYILQLRHENDMDYKDIADKMQMPLGTVKAQLFRARKLLHEQLKGNSLFSGLDD